MKRWQTKNEKLMVGGLFILLMAGSFQLTDWTGLKHGAANLSSDDASASADSKTFVKKKMTINKKKFSAKLTPNEQDKSQTKVEVSPVGRLEGSPCDECKTYIVDLELKDATDTTIKPILEIVSKMVDPSLNDDTDEDQSETNIAKKKKKHRKTYADDEEDDDVDSDKIAEGRRLITKACKNKSKGSEHTYCAMKKLGELAKLKGDDGFDDGDLLEIFNDEVKTGLNSLMKKKETAQDAMEELMVLFAKSEGVAGTEFRTGLLDFTKNQFIKDATEINKLKRQIAIAEKTDPQLAYLLNNKLMLKLAGFEENSNRFTSLLKYGYQDLIDGESITLDDADLELYQNYLNPISKLREALSSGRSSADLDRLLGDHQGINNAGRTARNQGGNYFPPLNGVGGNFQNGNFQNNNPNARNFPQNGNFNTRTGGVQQPVYPNNYNRGNGGANWFSPSGNNAVAPNGPYNNQPFNYPPNGYNTAQPYRGANAPYMGTPGFNNGVNQYNTYGYGFPGGGYRQPYPGYQSNFTPNGPTQYPGAPMQYGPPGGGAARPRY